MERIGSPGRTREIIEKYGFYFKKSFGQNFLIDGNILDMIADAAEVMEEDTVLEVGPGIGSLTETLARRAKKVIAVEIDKNLIPILQDTLGGYDNVEIINGDILKTDLKLLSEEKNGGRPFKVAANLPYYITTPVMEYLIENRAYVSSLTLMMQKEVAGRLCATNEKGDYGAISVYMGYYTDAKVDFIVSPSCFMPRPKVESAVVTLKMLKTPKVSVKSEELLFSLVRSGFLKRRKTFPNCIDTVKGVNIGKADFAALLSDLGIDPRIRAEKLSLSDFAAISDELIRRGYYAG